jgi:hypothetical protein
LRECWLAHERLHVSEARSINRAEILTARTVAAAEAAEVTAVEAAAAEAAAAAKAAAAAGAAAKAAADALGARAALAPELLKESGGGAGGMAEDAEEISGGGHIYCRGPIGIGNSRRVAQQRESKRGSPGREIDTDQNFNIT